MNKIEIIEICSVVIFAIVDLILNYTIPHEKYEFHIATMILFWGIMNYVQGLK